MRPALLFLFAVCGFAQSQSGFCAAGIAGLAQSAPHLTGWYACATPLSQQNQAWLIGGTYYAPQKISGVNQHVPVSFAAAASVLRQFTFATLFGYLGAGAATLPASTSSAFTGGGFLRGQFKTSNWSWNLGIDELKTNAGSATVAHAGIGATW